MCQLSNASMNAYGPEKIFSIPEPLSLQLHTVVNCQTEDRHTASAMSPVKQLNSLQLTYLC